VGLKGPSKLFPDAGPPMSGVDNGVGVVWERIGGAKTLEKMSVSANMLFTASKQRS
jgi:hypothetical protein